MNVLLSSMSIILLLYITDIYCIQDFIGYENISLKDFCEVKQICNFTEEINVYCNTHNALRRYRRGITKCCIDGCSIDQLLSDYCMHRKDFAKKDCSNYIAKQTQSSSAESPSIQQKSSQKVQELINNTIEKDESTKSTAIIGSPEDLGTTVIVSIQPSYIYSRYPRGNSQTYNYLRQTN